MFLQSLESDPNNTRSLQDYATLLSNCLQETRAANLFIKRLDLVSFLIIAPDKSIWRF